ncbi:hypothetical protein [uncultured Cohaesibacter sp.]|uniref:hypothetical protein n=1 Tax=uncultured Cohaesibacter sp. TaxID=1002546 RepID=UPI00292D4D2A|nr:hypothetical protein [uncultured Cohaesibacter sp.]
MNITIHCFGAFRPFGETLSLSVSHGATVTDLHGLFLKEGMQLTVIPPASGGQK